MSDSTSTAATFPVTSGVFQPDRVGPINAIVVKVNSTGSGLVYASFLGGGGDSGRAIALDGAGNAYIVGNTSSTAATFPVTPGAFQAENGGSVDAFVAKVSPGGSSLSYATFLGGETGDQAFAVAVDGAGDAYITGFSDSTGATFPVTAGAFQRDNAGGLFDAFLAKIREMAASPTIVTMASPAVALGAPVTDTATLAGGAGPGGTITFRLYGPNDDTCAGSVAFTSTVTVAGNGGYPSAPFTPSVAGTYRWAADYSGDANNNPASSPCNAANESVEVRPPTSTSTSTTTMISGTTTTTVSPTTTTTVSPTTTTTVSPTTTTTSAPDDDSDDVGPPNIGQPETPPPTTVPLPLATTTAVTATAAVTTTTAVTTTAPTTTSTTMSAVAPTPNPPPALDPPAPVQPTATSSPVGDPILPEPFVPAALLPEVAPLSVVPVVPPTILEAVRPESVPGVRPLVVRGIGPGRPSALPGGLVEATGTDCPAGSEVTLRLGGRDIGRATANALGRFETQLTLPSDEKVGRRLVSAVCGSVALEGSLDLVQTSSNLSPGSGVTTLAALLSLYFLIVLVLRSTQQERRPRR